MKVNKVCTKCEIDKPIIMFSKHYKNIGGLQSWCKLCVYENKEKWRIENRDREKVWEKEYRKSDKRIAYVKEYKDRNRAKIIRQNIEYNKAHRQKINERSIELDRIDPNWKLRRRIRTRLFITLRKSGVKRRERTEILLDCKWDDFKIHMERQFEPGMSWDNHGQWHIDHILPLKSFDLTDPDQLKKAWNFKNLQPLWAVDNLRKAAKILEPRDKKLSG